jgi:serine/threonine-protein kinase
VLGLVERLRSEGREARAIDLARRILARHSGLDRLALRVAELLAARGEDAPASRLLDPLIGAAEPPNDALMLAAEIAERASENDSALALYEHVLSRDLDYPRAAERAQRLRDHREPRRDVVGATLMTDGALARGRYRVKRELGRGGAGTVFAALDVELGRMVALKVYHRRSKLDRERLRLEARMPARVEHPGVVRIFDLDETLGAIAMELVRGGSVRQELKKGVVPMARVERWLATALEALLQVHRGGIVHRDIKPSNFLLREDDRVVLADFGLAAAAGKSPAFRAGGGEGTLAYMAPEQRAGAPAHASADVYAFGATLREVCAQAVDADPTFAKVAEGCLRAQPSERPTVDALLARIG